MVDKRSYAFSFEGFSLNLFVDELALTPGQDVLDLSTTIAFELPPAELSLFAEAADVDLFGIQFTVISINETCTLSVDRTPITVGTAVSILLDAAVRPPDLTVGIAPVTLALTLQDRINIDGCTIGTIFDFIDAVTGFIGGLFNFDIYQILVDAITPFINGFVQDLLEDIQELLQDLVGALIIEERFELLDTVLDISLAPSELVLRPEGLRFALEGSVLGPGQPAPCVSAYPQPGSRATGAAPPRLGSGRPPVRHHLGVHLDDDFLNQALYAIWYQGLLCQSIGGGAGGLDIPLPIPLDTSLLGLLAGGAFDEFFPDPKPLRIETRPRTPPYAEIDRKRDIDLLLEDFGLDLYGELDGRFVRAAGLLIDVDAGVNLGFEPATGEIDLDLALGAGAFDFRMGYNELAPEANEQIVGGIGNLVDTLLGTLLGGLTSGLGFGLPAFEGIGVSLIDAGATGPDADFLGVLVWLGEVDYEGDFDLDGGCAGGCGGCDAQGAPGPWWLWGGAVLLWVRRRRG